MKSLKIVGFVCFFAVSVLFGTAALGQDTNICEEVKKCKDEICEVSKSCPPTAPAPQSAAPPKLKTTWIPVYVCSGNFDPQKSRDGKLCVCKEPEKYHPYSLGKGWEPIPNKVDPSNPNVKYNRLYVRCDMSAQAVLDATRHDMNLQHQDIVDLTERVSKVEGIAADHEKRIGVLETDGQQLRKDVNELDTRKASKRELSLKADKADLDKKADMEWVKRYARRIHLTPTGGLAYVAIPGAQMGFGVMDIALGGLLGESGDVGLDVGGRFMFSPRGLNSNTYPGKKSGQVYGVGVYTRLTFALSNDKRTRLGVGGSYTEFGRFDSNAERGAGLLGLDMSIRIPLSDQVVLIPFGVIGNTSYADGPHRTTGLGGIIGITLGVSF